MVWYVFVNVMGRNEKKEKEKRKLADMGKRYVHLSVTYMKAESLCKKYGLWSKNNDGIK